MKLSHKLMMVAGGGSSPSPSPPDFLDLVGTQTVPAVSSSSSTFTVPLPAHQNGDLLVVTLQVATGFGSGQGLAPDGWTLIASQTNPGNGNAARMYYRIANSSAETFEVSARTDIATSRAGMGFVFRSKTGRVPNIEYVGLGTGDTYPALTPSAGIQKYSFLLGWFGKRESSLVSSPTFPSGYSKIAETSYVGAPGRYIRSAMGQQNLETDTTTPGAMLDNGTSPYSVYIAAVVWED